MDQRKPAHIQSLSDLTDKGNKIATKLGQHLFGSAPTSPRQNGWSSSRDHLLMTEKAVKESAVLILAKAV